MANAALVLGILSLVTWLLPLLGLPIALIGVIVSIIAIWRKESRGGRSLAGFIMADIGLILAILNMVIGFLFLGQVI